VWQWQKLQADAKANSYTLFALVSYSNSFFLLIVGPIFNVATATIAKPYGNGIE
jgi:hypothetical protein